MRAMSTLEASILAAAGAEQILAGEPVLAATYTVPPRRDPNDLSGPLIAFGGVAGALVGAALDEAKAGARRKAVPFKLGGAMAIALTPSRVLFWAYEGWFGLRMRPHRFLGELPLGDVEKVELSRRRGVIAFWLRNGRTVELDLKDRDIDSARAFTAAAADRITALA
jgi:hypothetical protein